ncbi:MAG: kelch repeat-containing protein, partial [Bacteroidota bacterium]
RIQSAPDPYPISQPGHSGLGSGARVWVWGGLDPDFFNLTYFNTGSIYDLNTLSWTAISNTGAPSVRANPVVLYDGSQVIVWGGQNPNLLKDGALYDPATDTWTLIPTDPVLNNLAGGNQAFLAQGRLVVIGVDSGTGITGGIYDLTTQTWTALNAAGAPTGRVEYTLISTGKTITLFGGRTAGTYYNDVYTFDPVANSWSSSSLTNAPTARARHGACWTGEEMIIFGGNTTGVPYLQDPAILQSPGFSSYYLYRKN